MVNRLQNTARQRVLELVAMALVTVAIASTSGVSATADTVVPSVLTPVDESDLSVRPSPTYREFGKSLGLINDTDLNPCSLPQELIVAQRTREQQQACYQGCVNRCWLRWMNRGHAGDRFGRQQQYLKCKNSCMWSCG